MILPLVEVRFKAPIEAILAPMFLISPLVVMLKLLPAMIWAVERFPLFIWLGGAKLLVLLVREARLREIFPADLMLPLLVRVAKEEFRGELTVRLSLAKMVEPLANAVPTLAPDPDPAVPPCLRRRSLVARVRWILGVRTLIPFIETSSKVMMSLPRELACAVLSPLMAISAASSPNLANSATALSSNSLIWGSGVKKTRTAFLARTLIGASEAMRRKGWCESSWSEANKSDEAF